MQARKLNILRGWAWLVEGLMFVRKAPVPLISSASTLVLCCMLLMVIPLLGQTAIVLLMPVFEVGMFLICRELAQGERIGPGLLFSGFRMNLRPLFALGGILLIGNLALLWLALLITGMNLARIQQIAAENSATMNVPPADYLRMVAVFMLLLLPLKMACWFAAPCISLRGLPLKKALFFSWVACWRNLGAMIVFGLGFGLVCGILPAFALALFGKLPAMLFMPLLALWIMSGVAVFYAAFYRSACDIFGEWPHPWTHEI